MGSEEEFPLPKNFGPYQLTRLIGAGGMARVYEARLSGLHGFEKRLAIKMMLPEYAGDTEFVTMLIDEAKIAVALNHSNICQVHDLGCIENRYFIAMEYVDGADLNRVVNTSLKRRTPIPFDVIAQIGQDVCAGLDYAHAKVDAKGKPLNIIHRDISPANILISMSGEVKIVDFGVAKATSRSQQTTVGVVKGKYQYMSPEQVTGSKIDHRSDIYAVGIVLYETLAGRMMYPDGPDMLDRVRLAKRRPLDRIRSDIPPDLDSIISRALNRKPKDRYQNAGEMGEALAEFRLIYQTRQGRGRLDELMFELFGRLKRKSSPKKRSKSVKTKQIETNERESQSTEQFDFRLPPTGIPEILDQPPRTEESPVQVRERQPSSQSVISKKGEKVLHIHGKVVQINETPPDIRDEPPRKTFSQESESLDIPDPWKHHDVAPLMHEPNLEELDWSADEEATRSSSSMEKASIERQGTISLPAIEEVSSLDLIHYDDDLTEDSTSDQPPSLDEAEESTLTLSATNEYSVEAPDEDDDPDLETSTDTFSVPHDIYDFALLQATVEDRESITAASEKIFPPASEDTGDILAVEHSVEEPDIELNIDVDLSHIGTSKAYTTTGHFFIRNPAGMTSGPFSRAQIRDMALGGSITSQDLASPASNESVSRPHHGATWVPAGLFIFDSDTEFEAQIALQLSSAVQSFDLNVESAARLFLQMAGQRRDGVLVFDRPGVHKEVTFSEGQPTYGSSNLSDEQLGKRLLRQGLLSPSGLTQALQMALDEHKTLSEVVVQLGMVQQLAVDASLERLIRFRLIQLFDWGTGHATLHPGHVDAAPLDILIEPIELITEGIQHSASPYGPTGWIVRKESETLILTGESSKPLQFFGIGHAEMRFLDRFSTPLRVKEVIEMMGREDTEKEEIAWAILVAFRLGCLAAVTE